MTHKKAVLAASTVLVIVLALLFVLLSFMSVRDDNLHFDTQGVNTLADFNAPLEDGEVTTQYTSANLPSGYSAIGGDSGRDFSYVRSNPTGKYMLVSDITISTLDTGTEFKGILDGNGHTITINAENTGISADRVGGFFSYLNGGTIKNVRVEVAKFRAGTSNNSMTGGVLVGFASGGAVIENTYVQLNYSPTSNANDENGGFCDFYLYQSSQTTDGSDIRLGGIAGATIGDTVIREVTVENNTTGAYGFAVKGWRAKKDSLGWGHSDGFHKLGGFIASADGGTVTMENVTLAGNASSKFTIYNESTDSNRYNSGMLGGLVGYNNNGTLNIDGFILSYPASVNSQSSGYNMLCSTSTNMNYSDMTCAGIMIGWDGDNDASYSAKNIYFVEGADTDWITGKNNSYHGVITFSPSLNPKFNGSNIYFYGATKVAPDSSELVYQIQNGSKLQAVTDQLILADGEVSGPAWVYGAKPGDSATEGKVNLNYSKVTQGSIELNTSLSVKSHDDTSLIFEKVYDGQIIEAPTLSLKQGGSASTITNVYTESAPDKNVGEHLLNFNKDSIVNAGYNAYTYNGKTVIGNAMTGVMYLPGNISVSGQSIALDITKNIKVNVTPLVIEVGFASTNFITYGDSLEAVKANNPDVRILAVNGVEGATAPDAIESWDIAGYVPYAQNVGSVVRLSVQNVVMANGTTDNYSITAMYKDTAIVARQLTGTISLADGVSLVYDGAPKTAKFTITSGNEDDPEIGDRITFEFDGTDNVNVGTFTVRAVLPTVDGVANYSFSADSVTKAEYTITPKPVEIGANSGQSKFYDNKNFEDFATLFSIPQGVDGQYLKYDYTITKDGAPAQAINGVGTYNVTATFQSGQNNYTSNSASAEFVVKKAQISGTIAMPENLEYDGTAKIPSYTFDEGKELYVEGEEISFSYSGSNVNAGTVTVTASLPNANYEFIVDGEVSDTQTASMTIAKRKVNLTVENIVKTYDGEIYDFSGVEVKGVENFVDEVTVSVTSPSAKADKGSYALEITTSLDGNSNYDIVKDTQKTLTINAKSVTLSIDNAVKTYDGKLFDFSGYTVNGMDGFLAKDAVTASVSAQEAKADKGVYVLVIATTADGNANYDIVRDTDKTLTINARSVTLTVADAESVYNGKPYDFTDYAVEIGGEGFVAEDNVQVSVSAQGNATDKGEYPLIITSTADADPNYSITRSEDKKLTVKALEVTVSAKEAQSKVYDGQAFEDFASLFNIPSGVDAQPLQFDYAIAKGGESADAIIDAGEYTVTATLKAGQDNYVCESASAVFTVEVLEVSVDAIQEKAIGSYDGKEVTEEELLRYFNIPVGVDGLPLEVELSVSGAGTQILNAGEYTVTLSLADKSGNYTATPSSLIYELLKKTVEIPVPEEQNLVYNASEQTFVIAENDLYVIEGNKATQAGDYEAVVSLVDTQNYQWSNGSTDAKTFAWSIEKAQSVVNPQIAGEHYYDGHAMPEITLAEGDTSGTIVWVEDELIFGINTYNWKFTPSDATNFEGAQGSVTLNVEAIELAALQAQFDAGETPIYTSTPVDTLKNYLVVKGFNNDGSDYGVIESQDYTLSGTLTAGTSTITVEYNGITTTFEVNGVIGVVLERIEITSSPKKTVYTVFEKLDTTGMVITAYFTDGTSETVTEECTADADTMAIGMDSVTFTYEHATGSKSVDLAVTVNTIKVNVPEVDELQDFVYNGELQEFVIPAGENYTVQGNTATDAGSYTAVVSLKDKTNYEWSQGGAENIEYQWTIEKMTIKGAIELPEDLVFDGNAKTAQFVISVGEMFDDDVIAVEYEGDTVNAGTVKVSVSLPGDNYQFDPSVVTSVDMVITPVEIELNFSTLTVVYNTPTEEFDINSVIATVRGVASNQVEIGGKTYDYTTTVEYADPQNTYKQGDEKDTTYALNVTLTIEGLDSKNYTYDNTAVLKVIATPLEGVLKADATNIEYDGKEHGATLTESEASPDDYEIQYSLKGKNQWSTALPVNAGTYTARVVATTDSYSGERISTVEIVILQKKVSITADQTSVSKAYKGEISADELESYFTAPAGVGEEGILDLAITVTGAGDKVNGVGAYTVTAKLASGLTNYSASSVSIKYTVVAAEVAVPVPDSQNFTYNGAEQTYQIASNALYTVSGNKATDAGSYTATVKLNDKKNYVWADTKTTQDKTFSWSIAKADPVVHPQVTDEIHYDGHEMPDITTEVGDTEGTIEWTVDELDIGTETYTWEFIPEDTDNYNVLKGTYELDVTAVEIVSIKVEVKPGAGIFTSSTMDEIKALLDITGTNNDGTTVEGMSPDEIRLEGTISEGAQLFTAYYIADESVNTSFAVSVSKVELARIEAVFEQGDLAVFPTTPLDDLKAYLTVYGYNNDGKPYGEITDYELSGNLNKIRSTVTVKYTGNATSLTVEDATFVVNVSTAALERIEITSNPSRMTYTAYDVFDSTGMVITAYYTDGNSQTVEDYEAVGGDKMQVKFATEGMIIRYTEDDIVTEAVLTGLEVVKLKVEIEVPTSQELVYNGKPQELVYRPGEHYTLEDNVQTNAGYYTAHLVLNDKENCEWNMGDDSHNSEDIDIPWSIARKSVSLTVKDGIVNQKVYDGVTITTEELKEYFELKISIDPDEENISEDDVDFEVVINGDADGICNAGTYTITAKLTSSSSNFTTTNPRFTYRIQKASKDMIADMSVGYKKLTFDLANGLEDAYYSFDNRNWNPLGSNELKVDMNDKYVVYLRYEESTNYFASEKTVILEKNITKDALYTYMKETFDDTIDKSDIVEFEKFLEYAKNPDGENAEFDKEFASLYAQYEVVAGELKQAITSALATGSKVAGYASAVAASLTLGTIGTGLALAALSVQTRKRDGKSGKHGRWFVAAVLVIVLIAGSVAAFAGCEKQEVDNLGDMLEIVKSYNGLKVEVIEGKESIYTYDNGAVSSNKYNIVLNVNDIIGTKGSANIGLTKDNLVSGYSIIIDESTGTATLKGKLQNTGVSTINGADIEIVCNLKTKTASEYKISYADEWGYNVVINLI